MESTLRYSLAEFRKITGLTKQEADEWPKRGFISTMPRPGSGKQREYTSLNLLETFVLKSLSRHVRVGALARVVRELTPDLEAWLNDESSRVSLLRFVVRRPGDLWVQEEHRVREILPPLAEFRHAPLTKRWLASVEIDLASVSELIRFRQRFS